MRTNERFVALQIISIVILLLLCGTRDKIFDNFICCEALTHSLLFKSKETFKLAEVQNLEASLQISFSECFPDDQRDDVALRFNLTRLLVDRATGSSLFRLDLQRKGGHEKTFTNVKSNGDSWVSPQIENLLRAQTLALSSLRRCDWVGQVIVEGYDPQQLIEELQQQDFLVSANNYGFDLDGWSLDYVKLLGETSFRKKPNYTMKSLLCAVAHEMPPRPSLTLDLAKSRFLIVDTATEGMDSSCFLVRYIDNVSKLENKSILQQKWARRPFQYSSAINFEVAEMVLEILVTLCTNRSQVSKPCDKNKIVLLDPTCGSGTFLALAMANGFYVEGCDINRSAAEGTIQNLKYLFDEEKVNLYANVQTHDSCNPWRYDKSSQSSKTADLSCVVANLPWGRNSVLYIDENARILCSIRAQIKTGTPCAFITRPSNSDEDKGPSSLFESTGFDILGQAFVPQRDFLLPKGKKNRKKPTTENSHNEDSGPTRKHDQCVITIARAKNCE